MCADPVTLALIGTAAAGVAGGVASAAGERVAGQAQADATRSAASLRERAAIEEGQAIAEAAEINAQFREQEARQVEELGEVEEANVRRRSEVALSQQIVDFAAAGRDPTSGSAIAVAFNSAREAEIDALNVRTDTQLRSEALRREAFVRRREGADALRSSEITAGGERIRFRSADAIEDAANLRAGAQILAGVNRAGQVLV